jgi:hypothetical protein
LASSRPLSVADPGFAAETVSPLADVAMFPAQAPVRKPARHPVAVDPRGEQLVTRYPAVLARRDPGDDVQ